MAKPSPDMVTVELGWPGPGLWQNRNSHWAEKAMCVATARQEAGWAFKEADRGRYLRDADCQGFELFFAFHLPKRGGRRPDLQNMPATQKAAIDGIADALGVDDAVFTVHWPTEWSEPIKGGSVVVQIAPSRLATAAERGV